MKKSYKVLISIGIVLVVALVGFQVNKTIVAQKQQKLQEEKILSDNEKEQKYREVISAIICKINKSSTGAETFTKSVSILQGLNGYLDSAYLIDFVNALNEIEKPQPNYSLIVQSLDKIPKDYKGDLYTYISQFKISNQGNAELRKYLLDKGYSVENLSEYKGIKKNDLDFKIIPLLKKSNIQFKYINDDIHSGLLNISSDNIVIVFNGAYVESMIKINDSSGKIIDASVILAELAKQRSIKYRKDLEEAFSKAEQSSTKENSNIPKIGMTSNEVLNTNWGKPTKVNKTTTAYGVSEQWVYGNGRYVYLEDGVVTAIQD